jgi:hypothetical protein
MATDTTLSSPSLNREHQLHLLLDILTPSLDTNARLAECKVHINHLPSRHTTSLSSILWLRLRHLLDNMHIRNRPWNTSTPRDTESGSIALVQRSPFATLMLRNLRFTSRLPSSTTCRRRQQGRHLENCTTTCRHHRCLSSRASRPPRSTHLLRLELSVFDQTVKIHHKLHMHQDKPVSLLSNMFAMTPHLQPVQ